MSNLDQSFEKEKFSTPAMIFEKFNQNKPLVSA